MSKKRRRHDRNIGHPLPAGAQPVGDPADVETAGAHPVGEQAFAEPEDRPQAGLLQPSLRPEADPGLIQSGDLFPMPAGLRLRAAREARGLTREEVARTAHIPSAVLADIEADRMEAMAPIYARGYLRSFARVVGVPEVDVVGTNTAEHAVPPLVPSHTPSRSRHLAQRYGNLLAYAMLTLVVLVPVVMLGLRPASQTVAPTPPQLAELDLIPAPRATSTDGSVAAAEAREPDADALAMGPPVSAARVAEPVPSPVRPVMASMAPLPEAAPAAAPEAPLSARKVVLRLAQSSWVELTGAEGQRIEYALLPAGTVREYQIAGNANLRIGNSRGASLSVDGTAVDLPAHSRSNVARVELGAVPAGR
jgi:cytoskeleton protein RodZ